MSNLCSWEYFRLGISRVQFLFYKIHSFTVIYEFDHDVHIYKHYSMNLIQKNVVKRVTHIIEYCYYQSIYILLVI